MLDTRLVNLIGLVVALLHNVIAISPSTNPQSSIPRPTAPDNCIDSDNVLVVGGGFIGSSFCAVFLASGKRVVCTDPYVSEVDLRDKIETIWPTIKARGIGGNINACTDTPPFERLIFEPNLETALQKNPTPFVQECTVENIESKQQVLGRLDELLADRPATIIEQHILHSS